jgi:hypothetical protein
MIDGVSTRPFWARTLAPFPVPDDSNPKAVLAASRSKYSVPREKVEAAISQWSAPVEGVKEERRPMRDKKPFEKRPPRPTREKPMGLREALKKGPVDFRGRPAPTKRPEVDTGELKSLLEKVQKEK